MKARYFFPLIAVAVIALTSCSIHISKHEGSDKVVTKTFDATDFDKLTLSCYADVVYIVSDTVSIDVTTSEDTMKDLEITTTADGHLTIGMADHSTNSFFVNTHSPDLTINISGPALQEIVLAGSGTFRCEGEMLTETFIGSVSGSGDIEIKSIKAENASFVIVGSGNTNIGGIEANKLDVSVSGSGDAAIHANNVANINANIVGSGDIMLDCKDCGTATASVSGSGDISMFGNLKQLNQSTAGSGDINISKLKIGE